MGRTALTVKSVVVSRGHLFVRLAAKRGDKDVVIHLAPASVMIV